MKYILTYIKNGDHFDDEFETLEEAIAEGEYNWNHLTSREQKSCEGFYILESSNPDEEAPDHYDGDIVKEWK